LLWAGPATIINRAIAKPFYVVPSYQHIIQYFFVYIQNKEIIIIKIIPSNNNNNTFSYSYLIHVLLKYSNFFGEIFYSILHISAQFIKKYKAYTRVDLKIGTKSGVENFIGTKSRK